MFAGHDKNLTENVKSKVMNISNEAEYTPKIIHNSIRKKFPSEYSFFNTVLKHRLITNTMYTNHLCVFNILRVHTLGRLEVFAQSKNQNKIWCTNIKTCRFLLMG